MLVITRETLFLMRQERLLKREGRASVDKRHDEASRPDLIRPSPLKGSVEKPGEFQDQAASVITEDIDMMKYNKTLSCLCNTLLTFCLLVGVADAGDLERRQAKRIHDRIAGVPPDVGVLNDMEADLVAGDATGAALRAMENSAFYNVTLKNFAAPWTNRDQTLFTPLNDYSATVIGMIRDEVPFTDVLSADLVYVGAPGLGLPAYSMSSNAHYDQLEEQGIDLKDNLVPVAQSAVTSLPPAATAGVMTTRAAAAAFFVAGTNRAI